VQNIILKKILCNKNDFYKTLALWLSKLPIYTIYGKYMVEATCNALMTKSCVSFHKLFSQKVLCKFVEKIIQKYVLHAKIKRILFCNN
jgi:hypothetical protein